MRVNNYLIFFHCFVLSFQLCRSQSGSSVAINKCSYRVPAVTCEMYIGDWIVFDASTRQCMVQTSGCSVAEVSAVAFSSLRACEATCLQTVTVPAQGPTLSPQEKCRYRIPAILCAMYIGPHYVFDANTGACTVQSGGCSATTVKANAFSSLEECVRTCGGGVPQQTTTTLRPVSRQDSRCSYFIPQRTCANFIGAFIVYDARRRACGIQANACDRSAVAAVAFNSRQECEQTCILSPGVATLQPPINVNKCSYRVPEITCAMVIGPYIVFDATTRLCTTQTSGCSDDAVRPYAFSSAQDCQRQCGTGGFVPPSTQLTTTPTTQRPLTGPEKCRYRLPDTVCSLFIGGFIVFDSQRQTCVIQSSGCSFEDARRNSFLSREECQRTCQSTVPIVSTTPALVGTDRRCSYQSPEATCMMYIGENVVYDSRIRQCTIATSGCSQNALDAVKFSSMAECQRICGSSGVPITTSAPIAGRCRFRLPEVTCMMYIGDNIVYDSVSRQCTTISSGCSMTAYEGVRFSSMAECQRTCQDTSATRVPVISVTLPNVNAKCTFRNTDFTCSRFLGNFIVYNADRRQCVIQNWGCDINQLQPYSFNSQAECERTCPSSSQTTTVAPVRSQKCSYMLPSFSCNVFIGQNIVYDSLTRQCVIQSSGCTAELVRPFAFASEAECRRTCMM